MTKIEGSQGFRDFEDFWEIHALPFHPIGKSIAKLTDDQRRILREKMKTTLPIGKDGTISYSARAVAFKARKAA